MVQKAPEETGAYKICHYKYEVEVPEGSIYSKAEMDVWGPFVTGDAEIDRKRAKQRTRVIRTIDEIVEHYHDGDKPILCNPRHAYDIYNIIVEHLNDVRDYAQSGVFQNMPPMEDLVALDKYAESIFDIARRYFVDDQETTSELMKFLQSRGMRKTQTREAAEKHESVVNRIDSPLGNRLWK